uniref:Uncharacterized protein n=1 Tax=Arundo donax TaxID=35708 RepID=A0A0A8Z4V8_ARUDO
MMKSASGNMLGIKLGES